MKFLGALATYLVMAFILGWGLVLAVKGSYWLLGVGFLAYLAAFVRVGCLPPGESH